MSTGRRRGFVRQRVRNAYAQKNIVYIFVAESATKSISRLSTRPTPSRAFRQVGVRPLCLVTHQHTRRVTPRLRLPCLCVCARVCEGVQGRFGICRTQLVLYSGTKKRKKGKKKGKHTSDVPAVKPESKMPVAHASLWCFIAHRRIK